MTEEMLRLVDFIKAYQAEHRIPPSYEEMAKALGIKAKSGIHRLVVSLERRGVLRRLPNCSRSIELIPERSAVRGAALSDEIIIRATEAGYLFADEDDGSFFVITGAQLRELIIEAMG